MNENTLPLGSVDRTQASRLSSPATIEETLGRRLAHHTPSLLPMVERLALVCCHSVPVLLTGETGVGKTHLGRLIHDCSPRQDEPFLTVPCGAIPANLVESTFFGHVRGAFTGACERRIGKFHAAGQGTILLDEIDTLTLEQQASLLRVLETGEFEAVGSERTQHCMARIVVASNWDLEEAVAQNRFRSDLYYRLNVMAFHLPPLRERPQDIGPLTRSLVARFTTKFGKDLSVIHRFTLEALEAFPWPGNIRQLENVIQQAVLLSKGPVLLVTHLPPEVREYHRAPQVVLPSERLESLRQNREVLDRNLLHRALVKNGSNRAQAAQALGISRVTLYKMLRKYGLLSL
jgi:transcriptional regulator with PAS, ATPase and Fis domain